MSVSIQCIHSNYTVYTHIVINTLNVPQVISQNVKSMYWITNHKSFFDVLNKTLRGTSVTIPGYVGRQQRPQISQYLPSSLFVSCEAFVLGLYTGICIPLK